MRHDRDELLARTDLAGLADELLGQHQGNGRNARWPSPVRDHPQTGRTPPMSIFTDQRGVQRWTCFATGAHGTAIDLVVTATGRSVGDAMAWLAERARLDRPPAERIPTPHRRPPAPSPREPSEALRAYVEACERVLWEPAGAAVRRWLVEDRGLSPDVLRRNRIGADPGPRMLGRAGGLPRGGPAAVFPVLDDGGQALYLQCRYLEPPPDRGKYDNPASRHGTNPRCAPIEPAAAASGPTIVTEGVPDALAAASVGYRAIAVLGAGVPDARVADVVAKRSGLLVAAFDNDAAGRSGATRLAALLRERQRRDIVTVEPPSGDLNAWLVDRGPTAFRDQLQLTIALGASGRGRSGRARSIA